MHEKCVSRGCSPVCLSVCRRVLSHCPWPRLLTHWLHLRGYLRVLAWSAPRSVSLDPVGGQRPRSTLQGETTHSLCSGEILAVWERRRRYFTVPPPHRGLTVSGFSEAAELAKKMRSLIQQVCRWCLERTGVAWMPGSGGYLRQPPYRSIGGSWAVGCVWGEVSCVRVLSLAVRVACVLSVQQCVHGSKVKRSSVVQGRSI